jgi:hypothetical protein
MYHCRKDSRSRDVRPDGSDETARRASTVWLSDQNRNSETGGQFAKARHWRAFLRVSGIVSPSAGLPGWRRSADRARLRAISLLSGNLTGNFANLGHLEMISD